MHAATVLQGTWFLEWSVHLYIIGYVFRSKKRSTNFWMLIFNDHLKTLDYIFISDQCQYFSNSCFLKYQWKATKSIGCVFSLQERIWKKKSLESPRVQLRHLTVLVHLLWIPAPWAYRPTDVCHFPTNPDGIIAGRGDLLVPAERRFLPNGEKRSTPHSSPSLSLFLIISTLEETFSDVSS